MTTQTMTLADFLLARIAEDENDMSVVPDEPPQVGCLGEAAGHWWTHDGLIVNPERVLAECEAKRRIVDAHMPANRIYTMDSFFKDAQWCVGCGYEASGDDRVTEDINDCPTLRVLAAVYADHPDYRPEWTV